MNQKSSIHAVVEDETDDDADERRSGIERSVEEIETEADCPSCAREWLANIHLLHVSPLMTVCACVSEAAEEVAQLREALEEARGDLADQQDAIAGVMAQRDEFQVEVRRLQFLLQLAVSHNSSQLLPASVYCYSTSLPPLCRNSHSTAMSR